MATGVIMPLNGRLYSGAIPLGTPDDVNSIINSPLTYTADANQPGQRNYQLIRRIINALATVNKVVVLTDPNDGGPTIVADVKRAVAQGHNSNV